MFAESGLFIGFFLPGDTLLFTAGLLSATHYFSIILVIALAIIAAILGDSFGYFFGRKTGKHLFKKADGFLFNHDNLKRSQEFYQKHGTKTIILARFVPVVRTFAPILAGASEMDYKTFLAYNAIGGIAWVTLMSLLGYFLGTVIPNIDHYVLPIVLAILAISFVPIGWNVIKEKRRK